MAKATCEKLIRVESDLIALALLKNESNFTALVNKLLRQHLEQEKQLTDDELEKQRLEYIDKTAGILAERDRREFLKKEVAAQAEAARAFAINAEAQAEKDATFKTWVSEFAFNNTDTEEEKKVKAQHVFDLEDAGRQLALSNGVALPVGGALRYYYDTVANNEVV